jgi:outer membrane protein OmpA-like peptidoglycan-associated protein
MKTRAAGAAAAVMVTACALWGCATQQVMLEMRRDVILRPPNISEIKVDPAGRVDTRGQASTVKVTMKGDPELKASFDLKGRAEDQAMQETEPGVYVGSFDVKPDETGKLDIVGHLVDSPTGARQEIREEGALELFTSEARQECSGPAAQEFEQQLKGLAVHFGLDKFDLTPEEMQALSAAKAVLESHPECILHLHGHADETGTPEHNMILSSERAGEVATFIEQSLGIPASRVAVHWHGDTQPLERARTPEALAKNRRVEFHATIAD